MTSYFWKVCFSWLKVTWDDIKASSSVYEDMKSGTQFQRAPCLSEDSCPLYWQYIIQGINATQIWFVSTLGLYTVPQKCLLFSRQELTLFFINPELLYIVTFKNTFDPILSFVFLLTQDTLFHFGMVENMKFYVYM